MPYWPLCCERKTVLSTKFRPGSRGLSLHMGTFSSRIPLRCRSQKLRSSLTGTAQLLIWTSQNFCEGKSGEPGWPCSYEEALKDALICRHLLGCTPTDPPESFRFSLSEKYQFGSPVFYISGNNVEFSEEKSPEECCKIWQFRASKRLNNLR